MSIEISVRGEFKEFSRSLGAAAQKQIKYGTALALTSLAKSVKEAESRQLGRVLKNPRPFTRNALGMKGARKTDLTATVFVRPIAAKYLRPYEEGGVHVLPGRSLLNPKDIKLDKHGQLPRKALARLKARKDIFIGAVKTKAGIVKGVWQRPVIKAKAKVQRGRARGSEASPAAATVGKLKLLIRFGDALTVNKRLNYQRTAKEEIARRQASAFREGLAKAQATAR